MRLSSNELDFSAKIVAARFRGGFAEVLYQPILVLLIQNINENS
jgi:hypothetical protein